MKRICFLFIFIFVFSNTAFPFWIWSPKSKEWKNPQYSPLASPNAQFEKAKELYESQDYKRAFDEFRKVLIHFPDSKQAPQAQFYKGKCLEALGKPYPAFKEYQKIVDSYPYSERILEIVGIQYQIGEYFLDRERREWLGFSFQDLFEHPSIEIFKTVIQNVPYSETAEEAHYKLGLLLKNLGRYEEAIKYFTNLIEKYPESKWVVPAHYQLALTSATASLDSPYDQGLTEKAQEQFEEFLSKHPDAELSQEVQAELGGLRDKEAKKHFDIGDFYYKQRDYQSAQMYYEYVIKNYPDSSWRETAEDKIKSIKNK
jgi:outer membrane protein assembly factor BamD